MTTQSEEPIEDVQERQPFEPLPGAPPAEYTEDATPLHICGHCFKLRKTDPERRNAQFCYCDRKTQNDYCPSGPPLMEYYRLCWCCAAVELHGNHKLQRHSCKRCDAASQRHPDPNKTNRKFPIGLHSIMQGGVRAEFTKDSPPPFINALRISDDLTEDDYAGFARSLNQMFGLIETCYQHRHIKTAEWCRRFGLYGQQQIPLDEYIAAFEGIDLDHDELASDLGVFIWSPVAWASLDPEFRVLKP